MDVREKLVELLKTSACPSTFTCDPTCKYYGFDDCFPERFADYLIANGVTVQEWISVEDRLPEKTLPPKDVLVYHDLKCGMFVDRAWYSYDKKRWYSVLGMKLKVTHWMPMPSTEGLK